MDEYVTQVQFKEFYKRMEDEHGRLTERIAELQKIDEKLYTLTTSVQELIFTVKELLKEQDKQTKRNDEQDERIDSIEARDGEMWRHVTKYAITTGVGIVVGYIFSQIGM